MYKLLIRDNVRMYVTHAIDAVKTINWMIETDFILVFIGIESFLNKDAMQSVIGINNSNNNSSSPVIPYNIITEPVIIISVFCVDILNIHCLSFIIITPVNIKTVINTVVIA